MRIFNKPFLLVLFHVLFISILPLYKASSPTTEARALVEWKNSLFESSLLDSWSLHNLQNHCNWIGIACNSAGSVSEIIISGQVSGTLAHFNFSSFPNLTVLDMSGINLTDSIPVDIGNATQLQRLWLFANNLNGNISYQISHLQKLQYIDLGLAYPNWSIFLDTPHLIFLLNDSFQGNIPSSIGLLTELQTLLLDHNNLNSSIPPELGLCTKLNILDLGGNSLTGPLPLSFSNLTQISDLSLWDNCLSGELLPHFISNWTELTSLDMKNNAFTGNIPSEIGLLTNLESLFLYTNNLTGPIPKEIGNLKQLHDLDLSENHLEGSIPSTVGNLTKLFDLELYSNNLSGTIPPEIGNSTQLIELYLNNNQLNGELPDSISYLSMLWALHIYSNSLSGSIPKDLGKYTPYLSQVDLSKNKLSGEIPITICKAALYLLDLSRNSFSGALPHCLGEGIKNNNQKNMIINLSKNQFQGKIPPSFCKATFLNMLDLSSNNLSGALPHCLGNLSISILDLHDNQIEGTIPPTFTKGCQLTTFNMNNNHMEGSMPIALANCELLQILDLGNNNISDTFPPWLVSLPNLQILILRSNRLRGKLSISKVKHPFPKLRIVDLSHNQFRGNLPIDFFENFKDMAESDQSVGLDTSKVDGSYYEASVFLTVKGNDVEVTRILYIYTSIDLSSNRFSGTVSEAIGKFKSLRLLNLSHNTLTGHISSSLGNMSLLESLDFSSNQLTGTIPLQLSTLEFLSTLKLSANNLSGAIPQGRHFDTFSNDSFLGNLALCGAPLTKKCKDDKFPTREEVDADVWIDWKMFSIGYGSGLVCGLSTGYIVFTTLKPWRFVRIIERAEQKLIRRYMKNT